MFTSEVESKNKISVEDIYVIKDLRQPLLSGTALDALGLIKKSVLMLCIMIGCLILLLRIIKKNFQRYLLV